MPKRPVRDIVLVASLALSMAACASSETTQSWDDGSGGAVINGYHDGSSANAFIPGSAIELSWDDREALGRIAFAEAGNQGELGIAAVIYTIFNRVTSGQFQSSIQDVIDARNQFEPATKVGGWRNLSPLRLSQGIQFDRILDQILAGDLPDPTNGALYFQNARIVAARAARGKGSWALVDFGGTPPVAEIGDHRFYDWRAGVNLAAARRRPAAEYVAYAEPSYTYVESPSWPEVAATTEVTEPSAAVNGYAAEAEPVAAAEAEYANSWTEINGYAPEAEPVVAAEGEYSTSDEMAATPLEPAYDAAAQTDELEDEGGFLTAADEGGSVW